MQPAPQAPKPALMLPPRLSIIRVDDDAVVDMRTNRALTAEEIQSGYVSFAEWFDLNVQTLIKRGCFWQKAATILAEELVRGFVQEPGKN